MSLFLQSYSDLHWLDYLLKCHLCGSDLGCFPPLPEPISTTIRHPEKPFNYQSAFSRTSRFCLDGHMHRLLASGNGRIC